MFVFLESFLNTSVYFVLFLLALSPLERVFPIHNQDFFRKEYFTDLIFFFAGNVVWAHLTLQVLKSLSFYHDENWFIDISHWHITLQVFTALFLCDLSIYWAHRLSHKIDFLWRFHKVHHSAESLDWLAAYREHPLDNIYTRVIENLPFLVLGVSLDTIASFVLFRGLWGNFIHSNSKFSMGPLKYILGSPRLHHWHHDIEKNGSVNFANLMPIMDVLFGTFHDPKSFPEKYGIKNQKKLNYFQHIFYPFLPSQKG